MIAVDFDFSSLDQLREAFGEIADRAIFQAYFKSVSRATQAAQTFGYQKYSDEFAGKINTLKKKREITSLLTKGNGKDVDTIASSVIFRAKSISLTAFKVRDVNPAGLLWGKGISAPRGFEAPVGGDDGTINYFQRDLNKAKEVPKKGRYAFRELKRGPNKGAYMKRQAIQKLWGISAAAFIQENEGAQNAIVLRASESMSTNVPIDLSYYMKAALGRLGRL